MLRRIISKVPISVNFVKNKIKFNNTTEKTNKYIYTHGKSELNILELGIKVRKSYILGAANTNDCKEARDI